MESETIRCHLPARYPWLVCFMAVLLMASEASAGVLFSPATSFAAGDAAMGASLVVWAIDQGRQAAASIDEWLARQ